MSNVLVTSIGSFAADIVIKTLKKNLHYIVGCDIYNKEWLADAYNVNVFEKAPLVSDSGKYLKFIIEICDKHDIQYIIPLIDPEVDFLSSKKEFLYKQHGIIVCTSNETTVKLCRDKFQLQQFLDFINVDEIIPTKFLKNINTDKLDYPVIIKPNKGRSSQGFYIKNDLNELESFIKTSNIDDYIIQPYIQGDILVVDVIRDPCSEQVICISRKEILRNKSGAGMTVQIIQNKYLTDISTYIANKLRIVGSVCFEFIYDESNEKLSFLEINPRFSGGVEFSNMAGYDIVLNHLRIFMGMPIDSKGKIKKMVITRKYEEYVTKYLDG